MESEFNTETGLPIKLKFDRDKPTLFSRAYFEKKEIDVGPKMFSSQYLCSPSESAVRSFDYEDVQFYDESPRKIAEGKNLYILVDPAGGRKKSRSYHAQWVIALGSDRNYYVVDLVIDDLNLVRRTAILFNRHRLFSNHHIMQVRYEKYAMQADIEHIEDKQKQENYRFVITEVGGVTSKNQRIERLLPSFTQNRWYFPRKLEYVQEADGKTVDLIKLFFDKEFKPWPETTRDDGLDGLARIAEPDSSDCGPLVWPKSSRSRNRNVDPYDVSRRRETTPNADSWMAA